MRTLAPHDVRFCCECEMLFLFLEYPGRLHMGKMWRRKGKDDTRDARPQLRTFAEDSRKAECHESSEDFEAHVREGHEEAEV